MARPATGTIIERRNAAGEITRTLRVPVNGRKRALALGVVTRADAETALRHALADVEQGRPWNRHGSTRPLHRRMRRRSTPTPSSGGH